ncbi:MAG: hypothetical protein A3K09_02200 [Nitrospinae bacterium RIFCSPLOWO2_12_FULL_47_7]|nr:MAG: hypothetical protein A3K09_02200 [Nitrospinae bacterium RIFCSPLOWO2_12_FULL_47_7]
MPCKDTTAKITVRLDPEERLIYFGYEKLTCSKIIGGGTGYKEYCVGRSIEEISKMEFADLLEILIPEGTENQLFLYLEWDALRTAIAQYEGREVDERRQLASISWDEGNVEICQVISAPKEMPKIASCTVRARRLGQD